MSLPERILAKYHVPPPESFLKAQANTVALTFDTLLTYPMRDLAGDYVRPEGCDFTPHHADPIIDLEHRRHPLIKGMPVASALAPDGTYSVRMVRLDFADAGKPPLWHTVPVGTEYYNKSCKISMQVFAMREQGLLPAASLEFSPVPGRFKAVGWSDLDQRNACDFDTVRVHRWTVCERGVNPGALLVLDKCLPRDSQVPSSVEKILRDKRVNVGGQWEPLHGYILKALAPEPTKRTTVIVGKSMSPDPAATAAPVDPALQTESAQAVDQMAPAPKPTVQAHYDFAQGMLDLIDQAEAQLESSEHVKGRKYLMKKFEKMRAEVDDIKANGDKIDAELSAGGAYGDDDEGDDDSDTDDDEGDSEAGDDDDGEDTRTEKKAQPVERDAEGVLKGIRPEYTPKRFRYVDLQAVVPIAEVQKSEEPSKEFDEAYAEFKKWQKWTKPKS